MRNNIYDHKPLKVPGSAPQASSSTAIANSVVRLGRTKRSGHERSGNTGYGARSNVGNHTVFVLDVDGKPLTPTTSTKARKLLKGNQACKVWSKFNTFGIRMLAKTRKEKPLTVLGVDPGSKFDGYSVVVHKENNLSVKLDLPSKKNIVRKLKERREARRTRRSRMRRRPARFKNRSRSGFLSPSQNVIIQSRLKIVRELCKMYPITKVGLEDVAFNHAKYRWGKYFSTCEIGKTKIKRWFENHQIEIIIFRGYETAKLRKKYGYKKTAIKSADKFSAHCSDSLTLAVKIGNKKSIDPGKFLVVDDTYRCIRRKIHYSNVTPGGIRKKCSSGTIFGLKKGLIIGTPSGIGQLRSRDRKYYVYYDAHLKRRKINQIYWINNQFKIKI